MKNLGINIISTSKSGLKREVVFLSKGKGNKKRGPNKGLPCLKSKTFLQYKVSGSWKPEKPINI